MPWTSEDARQYMAARRAARRAAGRCPECGGGLPCEWCRHLAKLRDVRYLDRREGAVP